MELAGLEDILSLLDDDSLRSLALTSTRFKISALRRLVLRRYGNLYLNIKGKIKEVDWYYILSRYGLDVALANEKASNGDIFILELLEKEGILPDEEGANWAAQNNHLDVLIWLDQRKILPNVDGANRAVLNRNFNILEWLASKGIFPS